MSYPNLNERIEDQSLLSRVLPVEEAVQKIKPHSILAISGFTKSGDPKTVLPALAKHFAKNHPDAKVALYSGASISDQTENPLAPYISKRAPYMSSSVSRSLIHDGSMDFADIHLSAFARNLMYGFYGDIDYAIVEVSAIKSNGRAVLTSSVGISAEALARAKNIIFEVNTASPNYEGLHDIFLPSRFPQSNWPLPIMNVKDRVGSHYVNFDPNKVVAIVESKIPDHPVTFKEASITEKTIASNVIDFLLKCQKNYGWEKNLPPIQSGVGNIANAVVKELESAPFERIKYWTEVFQDGMLRCLENPDKFEGASSTAISLSKEGREFFDKNLELCRQKLVLRPMWISNSPEIITRLFTVAMNTPIEVDIYGHVNSTHIDGSRLINGLGGSGDFLRNAYISIVHTPSVRKLKDGRTVSCVMPYIRHIDHTEHDVKCIVTEHGYSVNTDISSPKKRAVDMINKCAHPYFRELLLDFMKISGPGDSPRILESKQLLDWWDAYNKACFNFS